MIARNQALYAPPSPEVIRQRLLFARNKDVVALQELQNGGKTSVAGKVGKAVLLGPAALLIGGKKSKIKRLTKRIKKYNLQLRLNIDNFEIIY